MANNVITFPRESLRDDAELHVEAIAAAVTDARRRDAEHALALAHEAARIARELRRSASDA